MHIRRSICSQIMLVALLCGAAPGFCAEAEGKAAVASKPKPAQPISLHQFMDREGGVTFTNRPDKYRHDRRFVEVDIKYQPIEVPQQYRNKAVTDYSSASIRELIRRYATHYGVEEDLVYAVIKMESNFNVRAVSRKGACGLMQLMPGTAAEMGVTNIFDPAQNIAGGTQYLAKMLELFKGDKRLALAAYNAGPGAVKQHNGIPPYAETQGYVRNVLAQTRRFKSGGTRAITGELSHLSYQAPQQQPAAATTQEKRFVVHFNSGLTQPADRVTEQDTYYYIEYGRRVYPVRKDLVKRIESPS